MLQRYNKNRTSASFLLTKCATFLIKCYWGTFSVPSTAKEAYFFAKKLACFAKKHYLCNGNQMKTVKTLHFGFFNLDISFSLSFVSACMWLAFCRQFCLSHMRMRNTTTMLPDETLKQPFRRETLKLLNIKYNFINLLTLKFKQL